MRKISIPQYAEYGIQATELLKNNEIYKKDMALIFEIMSETELIEFFCAVAKKESTGPSHQHIGHYEYFRFENGNVLSVGSGHVLLK